MAKSTKLSPRKMRWMFNLYPPLLFQRIRCTYVAEDFRQMDFRIRKSRWNKNHNGTIFGGTIYAAADPVIPVMYWQGLKERGILIQAWLMAASIQFEKPGDTDLYLRFALAEEDFDQAEAELAERKKSVRTHQVEVHNGDGERCANAEVVTYLRLLRQGDETLAGF